MSQIMIWRAKQKPTRALLHICIVKQRPEKSKVLVVGRFAIEEIMGQPAIAAGANSRKIVHSFARGKLRRSCASRLAAFLVLSAVSLRSTHHFSHQRFRFTKHPSASGESSFAVVDEQDDMPLNEKARIGASVALSIATNRLLQGNFSTDNHYKKVAEWFIDMNAVRDAGPDCLVYSFGVGDDDPYTDFMASFCTVIALDPSVKSYKKHSNITFYPWGLVASTKAKVWSHPVYGTVSSSSLYSLPQIIQKLGHQGRTIAAIKFDCEGCEFGAFLDMRHLSNRVLSYQTEFHLTTSLGMNSTEDVARIRDFFMFFEERNCRVRYYRQNRGFRRDRQVFPLLVENGVPDGVCCYEYTFSCER